MRSQGLVEVRSEVLGHPHSNAPVRGAFLKGLFRPADAVFEGDFRNPAKGVFSGAESLTCHERPKAERATAGLKQPHEEAHPGGDLEVVTWIAGLAEDGLHLDAAHAVSAGVVQQADAALHFAVTGHGSEVARVEIGRGARQGRPYVPGDGLHVVEPPPRCPVQGTAMPQIDGMVIGVRGGHGVSGCETMTSMGR